MEDENKANELWKLLKETNSMSFKELKNLNLGNIEEHAKFYTRNKSMMGCSVDSNGGSSEMEVVIEGKHVGIIAGHAYSILDVFEINKPTGKKRSRLMRIRNPWGHKEWNGKWCDDSEELKKYKNRIEEELNKKYEGTNEKICLNQDDGTFIMRFSDFRKIFSKVFICANLPPTYVGVRFYGKWRNGEGGLPLHGTMDEERNFSKNPQFYFRKGKNDKSKVCISLLQKDGRLSGKDFPYNGEVQKVCLLIFKVNNSSPINGLNGLMEKTLIVQRRDAVLELNLDQGQYIIVPSVMTPEGGDYCLELYFEDEINAPHISKEVQFDCSLLKNNYLQQIYGEPAKCELITEFIYSQAEEVSQQKASFIMSKFVNAMKKDISIIKEKVLEDEDFKFN